MCLGKISLEDCLLEKNVLWIHLELSSIRLEDILISWQTSEMYPFDVVKIEQKPML